MDDTKEKEIKINPEQGFRCEYVETDDEHADKLDKLLRDVEERRGRRETDEQLG